MSTRNLSINLETRQDSNGKDYYVGKLEGPFTINCEDGVAFLLFTSDVGAEELQIASMQKSKDRKDRKDDRRYDDVIVEKK